MIRLFLLLLCLALPLNSVAETAEELDLGESVPIEDYDEDGEMILTDDEDEALLLPAAPQNPDSIEETLQISALSFGDEGSDVVELQIRLKELGYYEGELSGKYREDTRAAVRLFQNEQNLAESGDADNETIAALFTVVYRPLQVGSTGDAVKRLQTRLANLAYYTGKISGNYLESTRRAVAEFQEYNDMPVTGIADVQTLYMVYNGMVKGRYETTARTPSPDESTRYIVEDDEDSNISVPYEKRLADGSKGEIVKTLQTRLTELGYYAGPISGNFLGKTTTAVKKFQKNNGLKQDGVVDESTWNAIFNTTDALSVKATPRPTPSPTPVPFYMVVDVRNQVTSVYGRDDSGEYSIIVRQMLCSTGTSKNPSDIGDFTLSGRKANWCYFPAFGSYARFWTKINSSIAFHSVIYDSVDLMDMNISSYKKLGHRASHGCIRLTVADAKWVYDNVGAGTVVHITDKLAYDPELIASLKLAPLNTKTMKPYSTPVPTAEPVYISGGTPPLPLKKLKKQDSSKEVWWLQKKLTELGYYTGKCSGTYLDGTYLAVKAFQKDHGLTVNGVADVKTLEALYAEELRNIQYEQ